MTRLLIELVAYWIITGLVGGSILGYFLNKHSRRRRVARQPGDIVWLNDLMRLNERT